MPMLNVRFIGITCFADGRETDAFVKRAILPNDTHAAHRSDGPHIPYVEVDVEDLDVQNGSVRPSKTFTRGGRTYQRFDLDGERISITNASQGNRLLNVIPTFDERVPSMTRVCPNCPPHPKEECFETAPPRDLVAAYFDIRSGFLSSGPVEDDETRFDEGSNWPPRRLARWAELNLSYHGDHPQILIEKFDGSGARTIPLKREVYGITIGNQMEEDIEERPVALAKEQRRGHFGMYYDLGEERALPKNRPRPAIPKGAVRGCAPLVWP